MASGSSPSIRVKNRKPSDQKLYDTILNKMVDNPEDIPAYQIKPAETNLLQKIETQPAFYEYVIITSNALKSYFNKFVEWKKRKGIDIGVVTVEDIYSSYTGGDLISGIDDNAGKIRQYLLDAYTEGAVWALLGGGYDYNTSSMVVPIRNGCGQNRNSWNDGTNCGNIDTYKIPADLYFADFNGDWDVDANEFYGQPYMLSPPLGYGSDTPDYNPEIFVGRLLCSSRQDILNWTEKVIQYEQNPGNGDLNYLTRSFMIVSDQMEDNFTPNQAERVRSHLPSALNSGSTIWRELQNGHSGEGTVPQGPTFPTGSQIIAELNNHYGLFSTFAHGNKNGITAMSDSTNTDPWWIIQPMDEMNNNVPEVGNGFDNLTNNKFPTICYSVSCSPTPFDAFNNCPWFSGINMGQGFTILSNGGGPAFLGNTRYGWIDNSYLIYEEFADLIAAGTTNLGAAELISKSNYSGGNAHYLEYSHNLIGCPEIEIWTNTPSQFSNVTITDNGNSIMVYPGEPDVTINVRSIDNGLNYDLTAYDVSSYAFNTSVRPLFITITNHNSQFLPYTAITGGTINTNLTLWGKLKVLGNLIVSSGHTLTIESGTTLSFAGNYSLTSNGVLSALGTSDNPITFTSASGTNPSSWGTLTLNGSGASGSVISFANILYSTQVEALNVPSFEISHSTFTNNYKAVYLSSSTGTISYNTITSNSSGHVIEIENSSNITCTENDITKTNRQGHGILYGGGSGGILTRNDIQGCDWGVGAIWSSSPQSRSSYYLGRNNRIKNCNVGIKVYRLSYPVFGYGPPCDQMYNSIYSNFSKNASIGTSYSEYASGTYAMGNWWGSNPPNTSTFEVGANAYFYYSPYLTSDPWSGIPKVVADNKGVNSSLVTAGRLSSVLPV